MSQETPINGLTTNRLIYDMILGIKADLDRREHEQKEEHRALAKELKDFKEAINQKFSDMKASAAYSKGKLAGLITAASIAGSVLTMVGGYLIG